MTLPWLHEGLHFLDHADEFKLFFIQLNMMAEILRPEVVRFSLTAPYFTHL